MTLDAVNAALERDGLPTIAIDDRLEAARWRHLVEYSAESQAALFAAHGAQVQAIAQRETRCMAARALGITVEALERMSDPVRRFAWAMTEPIRHDATGEEIAHSLNAVTPRPGSWSRGWEPHAFVFNPSDKMHAAAAKWGTPFDVTIRTVPPRDVNAPAYETCDYLRIIATPPGVRLERFNRRGARPLFGLCDSFRAAGVPMPHPDGQISYEVPQWEQTRGRYYEPKTIGYGVPE